MEFIDKDLLLKDIDESVVFSVKSGAPSPEIRGANKIIDRIKNAPAADVEEVKHGKWLKKSQRQKINGSIIHRPCLVCSICERKHFALVSYNYCPNCGAKMDKENAQ